jgi:OmpA-OmpF porin, OOP family
MKWLGDNGIPNNPDETTYDPDALNWVNANDYIEAATKYITGFCVDMKNKKTGSKDKHCVQGIVTWTPGDVNASEQKGGIVPIVSTEEYRSQMPSIIIGNKKWINANHELVKNMLAAILEGGDAVKSSPDALRQAAAVSAAVYNEKDGDYWQKYYTPQIVKDKAGLTVRLGGSTVDNLADNVHLFGLEPGSTNLFAATYTTFGNVVKQQYPDLVPNFPPVSDILDMSFVKELDAATTTKGTADVAKFDPSQAKQQATQVVSRKNWNIQFDTGKATFSPGAEDQLKKLLNDLVIASGTTVEIHGHTDNQGSAESNKQLSEDRAFAVKAWLEKNAPANFPEGRIKIFAHGDTNPIASNATSDGKAKNRRVEIVLGATSQSS